MNWKSLGILASFSTVLILLTLTFVVSRPTRLSITCIRENVGLGSPPTIFTTNASESINSVLKKQVGYKKTQWPEFVKEMKQLVDAQRSEIIQVEVAIDWQKVIDS